MTSRIVTITSLNSEGAGVATVEGKKVFVEGALPGESVLIKITEQKKSYAKGNVLSLLSPSYERTEPLCPLFGECGGCQLMHLQYPAQLEQKRKRVEEALYRIGRFENLEVLPCVPSPFSLGYRNKIQLPVVWESGKKTIGLYRKKSHEVIPLKQCLIQCSQGEEILNLINEKLTLPTVRHVLIRNAIFREEALVIFVTSGSFSKELKKFAQELMRANTLIKGVVENLNTRSDNVVLGPKFRLLAGRPYIYETLLKKTFKISPSAFFQVNGAQAEKLYEKALQLAEIKANETILDAYCGVGGFALFAADVAKKAYGIECVAHAIADAIENARLNHLSNCTFICGKAEEVIHELKAIDTVFLNPPRKGCDSELLYALIKKEPKKIIYISCDPATLARDLAILNSAYEIDTIQPFDMFPQTSHVETVVRLQRRLNKI